MRWAARSIGDLARPLHVEHAVLRELQVSVGQSGYAAFYEIEENHTVTILAVRRQREDDGL